MRYYRYPTVIKEKKGMVSLYECSINIIFTVSVNFRLQLFISVNKKTNKKSYQ